MRRIPLLSVGVTTLTDFAEDDLSMATKATGGLQPGDERQPLGTQIQYAGLINDVAMAIHDDGIASQSLTLEITESMMMRNIDSTIETLQAIRNLGVQVAIDDSHPHREMASSTAWPQALLAPSTSRLPRPTTRVAGSANFDGRCVVRGYRRGYRQDSIRSVPRCAAVLYLFKAGSPAGHRGCIEPGSESVLSTRAAPTRSTRPRVATSTPSAPRGHRPPGCCKFSRSWSVPEPWEAQ